VTVVAVGGDNGVAFFDAAEPADGGGFHPRVHVQVSSGEALTVGASRLVFEYAQPQHFAVVVQKMIGRLNQLAIRRRFSG
jgi:hypothetical protein